MKKDLLIKNARLLVKSDSPVEDGKSILIEKGRIKKIDSEIFCPGIETLNVEGATVMPGLIDSHVHLESVPGSYYRKDSEEVLWKHRKHQLRAYLAC